MSARVHSGEISRKLCGSLLAFFFLGLLALFERFRAERIGTEPKRIREIDGIPARVAVEIQAPSDANRVRLRGRTLEARLAQCTTDRDDLSPFSDEPTDKTVSNGLASSAASEIAPEPRQHCPLLSDHDHSSSGGFLHRQ